VIAVAARQRIPALDILRGIAILGIFFMNIPAMGQFIEAAPQRLGWTLPDRLAFITQFLFLEGTQRGLLELLFGAGLVILASGRHGGDERALAALWRRRNLCLLALGLIHAFVFLWFGEILAIYGVAALLVFPFRHAKPARLLVGAAAALLAGNAMLAAGDVASRRERIAAAPAAVAAVAAGTATAAQHDTADDWQALRAYYHGGGEDDARDAAGHAAGLAAYARWAWTVWRDWAPSLPIDIFEAGCTMAIGMTLYHWGIIQGRGSRRLYRRLLLGGYGVGLVLRTAALLPELAMAIEPHWTWYTEQPARLAMTLGHLGAVHLALGTRMGAQLLAPFAACGQIPLTTYFGQSVIGMWLLFAPFGLGLWGRFGWADLTLVAFTVLAGQLLLANLWVRRFANGPFEWVWKSLTYREIQPWRRGEPELSP